MKYIIVPLLLVSFSIEAGTCKDSNGRSPICLKKNSSFVVVDDLVVCGSEKPEVEAKHKKVIKLKAGEMKTFSRGEDYSFDVVCADEEPVQ